MTERKIMMLEGKIKARKECRRRRRQRGKYYCRAPKQ